MNYIGSISILDRGDAPAQAVIDRNARSLAQRVADETKDELNKVMLRVHTIYNAMDTVEDIYLNPSMEYVHDLAELEVILKDEIKKRQYQQQVTVFIVGYQDVCHQKLRLMQQVHEFFLDNSKRIDEEDWFPTTPDVDLEEVGIAVEESLNHAHELINRLAELNKEMIDYMTSMTEKKASNKGRKKIEKALQHAREEVSGLSEKLLSLQRELDDKEEKVHSLLKQMESRNLDVQKFRTAAELAKQKIILLQKELEEQKSIHEKTKADLTKLLDKEISALHDSHQQELEELRKQQESGVTVLQEEMTTLRTELTRLERQEQEPNTATSSDVGREINAPSNQVSHQSSKQESQLSAKENKTSGKSLAPAVKPSKAASKSPSRGKPETKTAGFSGGTKSGRKEFAETSTQDEGGRATTTMVEEKARVSTIKQRKLSKPTLEPVPESDFDHAFDLFDEQSWAAVTNDQLASRFAQYRRLSTRQLHELEELLQMNTAKTRRKVATLKAQFQEHKSKWEAERKILIEQVGQSLKLHSDAEKEADAALTQLQDFITEQERLEQEEVKKLNEVLQTSSCPPSQGHQTPAQGTVELTPGSSTPYPASTVPVTPESEQELQRLMQQTDDAKVQELNARLGTSVSAPPAIDMDLSILHQAEQDEDSKTVQNDVMQTSEVNLTQFRDISEDYQSSPTLPDTPKATIHSSICDQLDTQLAEFSENDPIRLQKEKQDASSGQLMNGKSYMGKNNNSDKKTPLDASQSQRATSQDVDDDISKQASETSLDVQKVYLRQSLSSIEGVKINRTTGEEIRASSALSRASLREQYKVKLEEAKLAAEGRRSKSPAVNVTTKLTVDDELICEEEDDEFALPDNVKGFLDQKYSSVCHVGTSPPTGFKNTSRHSTHLSEDSPKLSGDSSRASKDLTVPTKEPTDSGQHVIQKIIRKGSNLLDHSLLKEYLKVYNGVVTFKKSIGKIFLDKDMMSAHQLTSELGALNFDHNKKAMPQVEEMTKNGLYVLEELSLLISNILLYDTEPPVSSLNFPSREATQKSLVPAIDSIFEHPVDSSAARNAAESRASTHNSQGHSHKSSNSSDKMLIQELQDQYNILKQQLEEDGKNHQEQLQRNTAVMLEMQETINELQRELSALGKSARRTQSALSSGKRILAHLKSPSPETSVMFTRLDSERNAKIMKKAVMEDKLDPEKYKEAVSKMDEYISLPAQRFAHLVKKYVHHIHMKVIEDKVKNSSSLDEEVFTILDKMGNLQNQRAQQWAERMDDMGIERLKLANLLMETLDAIEQESGIFLIKPMYSYRGRDTKVGYAGKLGRPVRHQNQCITPPKDAGSSLVPAPTPASNYRLVRHERNVQPQQPSALTDVQAVERSGWDEGEVKIMGNAMSFRALSPRATWNVQSSQLWPGKNDPANLYNTPRILELDINRMLIGQNNISTKVPLPSSNDRLVNVSQNTLRSYITVNRPTVALGYDGVSGQNQLHSTDRSSAKKIQVSDADKVIPTSFVSSCLLPPIVPTPAEDVNSSKAGDVEWRGKRSAARMSDR